MSTQINMYYAIGTMFDYQVFKDRYDRLSALQDNAEMVWAL